MSDQEKTKGHPPADQAAGDSQPSDDTGHKIDGGFIKHLSSSLNILSLYPADHPACNSALTDLQSSAGSILEKKEKLVIGVVGDELVVNGEPLLEKSPVYLGMAELFHQKKIDKIIISRGVTGKELKEFILAFSGDSHEGHSSFNEILESRGVINIRAGGMESTRSEKRSRADTKGMEAAEKDYKNGMETSREIIEKARDGREIRSGEVSALANLLVRGILENRASMMTILNMHSKDDYLTTHCLDVALLTLLQVDRFNLGEEMQKDIACAAILHDLGKLNVPDEILNKPGSLSAEEWKIIQKHPVWGAEKNRLIKGITELAVIVSFEHHRRYDQKGYPKCRGGKQAAALSMMVAVADAYDAMRSKRAYQEEMLPEAAAAALLKSAGTSLHPVMVKKFIERVGAFGLGTLVRLSTGETGLVIKNNKSDPYNPIVKIMNEEGGHLVGGKVVNTSAPPGVEAPVKVERSLESTDKYRDIIWDEDIRM